MRYAAAITLLLCACSSLSSEDRTKLADYQRNAKRFWQGNRLPQALIQVDKGLELEPDDYTLGTMKGAILLKQSPSSQGTDHRLLDQATAVLERVFDVRSERRHEPALLFNYALALQKQARRHTGEATRLEAIAKRNIEVVDTSKVAASRERATHDLEFSERLLKGLIDRGELLRMCHYHLLLAARDTDRPAAVETHTEEYLKIAAEEQKFTKSEIDRTNEPGYEHDKKILLVRLRHEELQIRSLLAEYHYGRKEYPIALEMLDRVLEIDPARSTDYYNRGRVLLHLDEDGKAKADFRKFLATTDLPASSEKALFAANVVSQ